MPTLADESAASSIKMLLIGDSGSGKTGALSSLVDAGYNLRILDYDNGLDALRNYTKDKSKLANVDFITLTDRMKAVGKTTLPDGVPLAFSQGLNLLTNWRYSIQDGKVLTSGGIFDTDLGSPSTWTSKEVLVIDSLTFMCSAALRYVLSMNGRAGQQPQIQDWGEAMRLIEDMLSLVYSPAIRCNVIMTSHLNYIENEGGGVKKAYPMALGSKLPPKVGRYFNTCVLARTQGSGDNVKRRIRTSSDVLIELKTPVPGIPTEIPLETGLLSIMNAVKTGKYA